MGLGEPEFLKNIGLYIESGSCPPHQALHMSVSSGERYGAQCMLHGPLPSYPADTS